MKKVVIVGANHAGLAVARNLLERGKQVEITIIDQGNSFGYINGATSLLLAGKITTHKDFFYSDISRVRKKVSQFYNYTVVWKIDFKKKKVFIKDRHKIVRSLPYDKLVLATGALSQTLKVVGSELEGIHNVKELHEVLLINQRLDSKKVKQVAVIGGGYIGIEIAEALRLRGKEVHLFEVNPYLLGKYYDEEFGELAARQLTRHGVAVHLDENIQKFEGKSGKVSAIVTKRRKYDVNLVILALGFVPNTTLARNHLACYTNGAYIVDEQQRTSDKDVYAVGDCATTFSYSLGDQVVEFSVAGALRGGYVVAKSILNEKISHNGTATINATRVFGLNFFSVGLTMRTASSYHLDVKKIDHNEWILLPTMSGNHKLRLRIIYRKSDQRLLGAQLCSEVDLTGMVEMLALAIQKNVTLDELGFSEFFFNLNFNKPDDLIIGIARNQKKE